MKEFNLEAMRRHFRYEDGRLFWLPRPDADFASVPAAASWRVRFEGKEAMACVDRKGYCRSHYRGRLWRRYQIIWLLFNDSLPEQLDHIDGNRANDRIENLRPASALINARNRRKPITNTSGAMGVTRHGKRWVARISQRHIGTFDTFEAALSARLKAAAEIGYHPNHGAR